MTVVEMLKSGLVTVSAAAQLAARQELSSGS